jgi:hypothetical protein
LAFQILPEEKEGEGGGEEEEKEDDHHDWCYMQHLCESSV